MRTVTTTERAMVECKEFGVGFWAGALARISLDKVAGGGGEASARARASRSGRMLEGLEFPVSSSESESMEMVIGPDPGGHLGGGKWLLYVMAAE